MRTVPRKRKVPQMPRTRRPAPRDEAPCGHSAGTPRPSPPRYLRSSSPSAAAVKRQDMCRSVPRPSNVSIDRSPPKKRATAREVGRPSPYPPISGRTPSASSGEEGHPAEENPQFPHVLCVD
eukprot:Polyplicarium_translucidae@DN2017_c0_g1_i1.p3